MDTITPDRFYGYFYATHDDGEEDPFLVVFERQIGYVVPIFSSTQKLVKALADTGHTAGEYKIHQIEDPVDFIQSIPEELGIFVDPEMNEDESWNGHELVRGEYIQ